MKCVDVEVKSLLRHIFQRNVSSNFGENKRLRHVILGSKLRVKHIATKTQMICRFCQIHRTSQAHTFQSCVCEPPDLQLPCQQHLGTLHECFQLVSERARERLVVGRQTTAFVVSCDTAERFPVASSLHVLQSSLHFLQSSETAHPIDAGSTAARLVHGHAAKSHSVGCSLEHFRATRKSNFQI